MTIALGVVCAGVAAAFLAPWQDWVAQRLRVMLESRGLQNVQLTITDIGLTQATLRDITIGADNPLTLQNLTVDYNVRDLWRGQLQTLRLSGLTITVWQQDKTWRLSGLTPATQPSDSPGFRLPATPETLARLPFGQIVLDDSTLHLTTESGTQATAPLTVTLSDLRGTPILEVQSPGLSGQHNAMTFSSGPFALTATLSTDAAQYAPAPVTADSAASPSAAGSSPPPGGAPPAGWRGTWTLADINVEGAPTDVPRLSGTGTIDATAEALTFAGRIESADHSWRSDFGLDYNVVDTADSRLRLSFISIPWKSGRLATKDVVFPLSGTTPLRLNLQVQRLSIDELLQSLTGKRVSATGLVSGTVPLIIGRDGSLTLQAGQLKAERPGTISMPPDVIPGDNEQIALVRRILENFQYQSLSVTTTTSGSAQTLSILMAVEGNNPEVYGGQAVKLNVNLTGDVLDFVRQNIMFLSDPQSLLRQGKNEKDN